MGVIEPDGRRVVAYGNLANDDPRILDGDTIFEIGSVSKTCSLPNVKADDLVFTIEIDLKIRKSSRESQSICTVASLLFLTF